MNLSTLPIIYTNQIKDLEKKGSVSMAEACLLRYSRALETQIQQSFKSITNALAREMAQEFGGRIKFVQIDNGGKLTAGGRLRKWQEGTVRGFSDIMLLMSTKCGQYNKVIFVEAKRIGAKHEIKIGSDQLECQKWLSEMGWSAYITNNPAYFREVICKEIKDFFKEYGLE